MDSYRTHVYKTLIGVIHMKTLDLRNMPCPQPVVACRNALSRGVEGNGGENANNMPFTLHVLVDNEAAAENVQRFLEQQSFSVHRQEQGSDFALTATATFSVEQARLQGENVQENHKRDTDEYKEYSLVFITTETLGRGDDDLGGKLMNTFLATLPEFGENLWRLILLNGGVKLAATQGPALGHLKALEDAGVHVLVCGTCLAHYGLMEHKEVGQTSNMLDIVTSLQRADKIIRP